jgi:hypothetical protein
MTADRSVGPYPVSLPSQPMKKWGQSQPSIDGRLVDLPGPYHRYEIGTFNTCSQGLTHWSLTNTGGGYNLGGASLPHHTSQSSQPTVSTFHLKVSPGLRLNIQQLPAELKRSNPKSHEWGSLYSTSTAIYHLIIALLMVSHQGIG